MKWCCVQWESLGPELAKVKEDEISKFVKEKGIPQSVFATTLKFLEGLDGYCPFCGSTLSTQPVSAPEVQEEKPAPPPEPIKRKPPRKCKSCRGTGSAGTGLKCMPCHGTGVIGYDQRVEEGIDATQSRKFGGKRADDYQKGLTSAQDGTGPAE